MYMQLSDIKFPIYVVHTDEVIRRDGILWCNGQVIDDKNIQAETLGERRLQTPHKNLYDLKYKLDDFASMTKHRGRFYVDSSGKFFVYEKSKTAKLVYHKINKIEKKDLATLIWINKVPFPFEIPRPPATHHFYAGVLYIDSQPSFLYETCETMKKITWRKV